MSKQIFRKEDKVFHWKYGWGKVISVRDSECFTWFEFKDVVTSKLIPVEELSFMKYDFVDGGLSHERPFEPEVGKSYRRKGCSVLVIDRVGVKDNYGFNSSGKWVKYIICWDESIWREATDEEVEAALEKEVIRRYGSNWKKIKIKECMRHGKAGMNTNSGRLISLIRKFDDGWSVQNENGCLFYKGQWAEPLEDDLRPDFKVGELILVKELYGGNWVTRFFDSYGEDFIITVGGETWTDFMKYDAKHHNTSKSPEQ